MTNTRIRVASRVGCALIVAGVLTSMASALAAGQPDATVCGQSPSVEAWRSVTKSGAPTPRAAHAAAWTGAAMLIWGGSDQSGPLSDGALYDPSTDSWAPMSQRGAPSARLLPAQVWSGSQLVVWGGVDSASNPVSDGAAYSPATDTWTPLPTSDAPRGMRPAGAVWSGTEMIIWGVHAPDGTSEGARYEPGAGSWGTVSTVGAPSARYGEVVAWTGTNLLVWGGISITQQQWLFDGALYNPVTDVWTPMTQTGAPGPFTPTVFAWAGTRLFVWGPWGAAGAYDPSTDTWSTMSTVGAPNGGVVSAVWDGCEIIACCSLSFPGDLLQGGRYDPLTDGWAPIPEVGAPPAHFWPSIVWDGQEAIVWGGRLGGTKANATDDGGRYAPPVVPVPACDRSSAWNCEQSE
jgi:hypothetical protein